MAITLTNRIAQEHEGNVVSSAPEDATTKRRRRAMQALSARGLPINRDENWKYANLRPLERARFAPAATAQPGAVCSDQLPARIEGYRRYAFVDGIFEPELSAPLDESGGVTVRSMRNAERTEALPEDPDVRFTLLNEAFATDGALVTTEPAAECVACVELVFISTGSGTGAASYPRVELRVAPRSRLGIIERHLSLGEEAHLVNGAVHVDVSAGARVEHYRVQQSSTNATWIDTLDAKVAQDANYQLYLIHLGAASARSTLHLDLSGERATCGLHVASVAERQQVHDVYALIDHAAAHSVSRQSFRGIAAGRARAACNSKVTVREGAHGADSHQSLRGLLAGADAEIDVRPQLEIHTDDVRCAHGATAGKLDDAMLFYLLSRGIDPDTAQLLLKWAFLEDVVARIPVPELRRQIEQGVAGRMSGTEALSELL